MSETLHMEKIDPQVYDTLVSLFYDLAKAVPIGVLNKALINTVVRDQCGQPIKVKYSDKALMRWSSVFVRQLVNYETEFSSSFLVQSGSQDGRLNSKDVGNEK